jgi:hypothetical protein
MLRDGRFVTCASPVFVEENPKFDEGRVVVFDVYEDDASVLSRELGTVQEYALDDRPFWGQLISLQKTPSTRPIFLQKPALRGIITIVNVNQPTGGKN